MNGCVCQMTPNFPTQGCFEYFYQQEMPKLNLFLGKIFNTQRNPNLNRLAEVLTNLHFSSFLLNFLTFLLFVDGLNLMICDLRTRAYATNLDFWASVARMMNVRLATNCVKAVNFAAKQKRRHWRSCHLRLFLARKIMRISAACLTSAIRSSYLRQNSKPYLKTVSKPTCIVMLHLLCTHSTGPASIPCAEKVNGNS
uniref:Uncharacterized protein n=1 Tax=Glossina austeni TaxID=7395 RepID=A0A1A9VLE5_GLOAU